MAPAALVLLAFQARPDVFDYIGVHPWPPEVALDELQGLALAEVSGNLGVMFGFQVHSNQVLWNLKPSLPVKGAIDLSGDSVRFAVCSNIKAFAVLRVFFAGDSDFLQGLLWPLHWGEGV